MFCSECGKPAPETAKFCVTCGYSLTQVCPVCSKSIPIGQAFCVHCGSNIESSISGLPIDRALAWKDLFERLGWSSFEVPDLIGHIGSQKVVMPVVLALLKQTNGPLSPSDEKEPWVLMTTVAPRPFHIEKLRVLGEEWKVLTSASAILATRCRLVFARSRRAGRPIPWEAYQWYYRDLVKWGRSGNEFSLMLCNGRGYTGMRLKENGELLGISDIKPVTCDGTQTIELKIQTHGRGIINQAAWVFGDRDSTRLVAASNMAARDETNADFLDVMDKFCSEIANCRAK